MKKTNVLLAVIAIACLISQAALAADISVPNTFTSGTQAKAEEVNQNFSTVYGAVNGINAKITDNITNRNISPTAQIEQSKIQGAPFAASSHTHKPAGSFYRWAVFSTYDQGSGWFMGNNASMFGGIAPSNWTDNNARARDMSSDKEVLRTLLTQKGYGGKNAMVYADEWMSYSSTNGKVVVALFRIKNNTASSIVWTPYFYFTSYGSYNECAGAAVNGSELWYNCGNNSSASVYLNINIPPNRTSTIIFNSPSGPVSSTVRGVMLGFFNNSLALPDGLEYVDDLDTATGGWEQ